MNPEAISPPTATHPLVKAILTEHNVCADDHYVVLADAEPVVPDHFLLVARQAHASLAEAGPGRLESFLESNFSPVCGNGYMLFEHGHGPFCSSFGTFVHAHAHLVPVGSIDSVCFSCGDELQFDTLSAALRCIAPNTEYLLWGIVGGPTRLVLNPVMAKRAIREELTRAKKSS